MTNSKAPGWNVIIRHFAWASAALFFVPILFLATYVGILHSPGSAVLPHLYVIGALGAGLAGLRLLIASLPIRLVYRRALAAACLSIVSAAIIGLYVGSIVGLKYWGKIPTVQMIVTYSTQLSKSLEALGYSVPLIVGALFLLSVLIAIVAFKALERIDWVEDFGRKVSSAVAITCVVGLVGIFASWAYRFEGLNWGGSAEPLSLSLFPTQAQKAAQSHGADIFRAGRLQHEHDVARASYAATTRAHSSNVIFIIVDALRADHLSLLGYERKTSPYLEGLKAQGVLRFSGSALAACNESFCGIRALLSSQYLDSQAERPFALHEVLKKHGYATHFILSGDHTNFYGLKEMYGPVDSYFDGASQNARYLNDDRLVLDRLRQIPAWTGVPTFFQFHLMSTHVLGVRFDETPEFGPSQAYIGMRWGSSVAEMPVKAKNFYDKGVLQTDKVISDLLERLKAGGYLNDALVVITGDHGESLGERGLYNHTHGVWEESLRVPFVLLSFGKSHLKSLETSRTVSQIDVAPTVLNALGIVSPDIWQGIPLQDSTERRYVRFQQTHLLGLLDQNSEAHYKHWIDARSGKTFTFDLMHDKGEQNNITDQVPRERLIEWHAELSKHSGALPEHTNLNLFSPAVD